MSKPEPQVETWTAHRGNVEAITADFWKRALEKVSGNITHAAELVGIARRQATRLTARYELREYAANLRVLAGSVRRGRPPGT